MPTLNQRLVCWDMLISCRFPQKEIIACCLDNLGNILLLPKYYYNMLAIKVRITSLLNHLANVYFI